MPKIRQYPNPSTGGSGSGGRWTFVGQAISPAVGTTTLSVTAPEGDTPKKYLIDFDIFPNGIALASLYCEILGWSGALGWSGRTLQMKGTYNPSGSLELNNNRVRITAASDPARIHGEMVLWTNKVTGISRGGGGWSVNTNEAGSIDFVWIQMRSDDVINALTGVKIFDAGGGGTLFESSILRLWKWSP